ncbi:MAG: hypothetical protein ACI85N_001917 [Gammaproteobacteria bacterium]|jgi:hypothetical protein
MKFDNYIGIDYSGAETTESRLKGLQVYKATQTDQPVKASTATHGVKNWSRLEVAQYCKKVLGSDETSIIGIDHGFSFPINYMKRYRLNTWDKFLVDFVRHWPTADPLTRVDSVRDNNPRTGNPTELRLCEEWTATAKSVFMFDVQGSVAKSTHSGLPWLLWLREIPMLQERVHFWPFDGFDVPDHKSVMVEAYPALYKRRFCKQNRSPDEHDAWSIAAWIKEADKRGILDRYFIPPLMSNERKKAELEGWILGVC